MPRRKRGQALVTRAQRRKARRGDRTRPKVAHGRGSTESGKTLLHPALRGAFLHEVEAATDIPRRAGS